MVKRLIAIAMILLSPHLSAQGRQALSMCVFDIAGRDGIVIKEMQMFQLEAFRWGIELSFQTYQDDRAASESFKNGRCDILNLPGFRVREFNSFTGSLNAVGALPSYQHLGIVIKSLSSPKAAKLMRVGDYEVIGIGPIGSLFLFVNDRRMQSPQDFVAKRVAVINTAPETTYLAERLRLKSVSSNLVQSLQKFSDQAVDIAAAPSVAYQSRKLAKGLGPNGGIINWPSALGTMQMIVRWEHVPEHFAQHSRNYWASRYPALVKTIQAHERAIPKRYWIQLNGAQQASWDEVFSASRTSLRNRKIYNAKALTLFRKVRCKLAPSRAECSAENLE